MGDVIIALVPAKGHEGLVAEGPMGERPALLYATGTTPAWSFVGPFETPRGVLLRALQATVNATRIQRGLLWSDLPFDRSCVARVGRIYEWLGAPRALVLHAPGGPRLGMVRAMEAVFGDAQPVGLAAEADRRSPTGWFGFAIRRPHDDGEGDGLPRDPVWAIPAPYGHQMPQRAVAFFALAHLLHQRGLASEVLVLPVPA